MSKLYIPRGVDKNKYFIEGYGAKEVLQSLIVCMFLLPLWLIIGFFLKFGYLSVVLGMGFLILSVTVTVKREEISVYDSIRQLIKYLNRQKVYDYKGGYNIERINKK